MAPSVADEPEVTLCDWRVIRTDGDTLHFVGRLAGRDTYRMSTSIQTVDTKERQGTTLSGRLYRLSGPAGLDLNIVRAALDPEIAAACEGWNDVTEELFARRH